MEPLSRSEPAAFVVLRRVVRFRSLFLAIVICASPSMAAGQDQFLTMGPQPGSGPTILPLGSLRAGFGGAGYITPASALNFDFNLTAGFRLAIMDRELLTVPLIEAGYCYHAGSAAEGEGHYFVGGAGISLGKLGLAGTLVPAYVVGSSRGDLVQGFRVAVRADAFLGITSLELAYEWRSVRGVDVHTIQFSLMVDLGIAASFAVSVNNAAHQQPRQTPRISEPEPGGERAPPAP